MHFYQDLISLFNDCFLKSTNTQLVKGDEEPLYLPADINLPHNTLFFAHGYFASALHECAHWLVAGEKRRKLVDFGYWYEPDGRTAEQQALFQKVEVKPQAIEWILSVAAKFPFRVSLDNLNSPPSDTAMFKKAIYSQVQIYCEQGLPARAETFRRALCEFYHTPLCLDLEDFELSKL